MKKIPRGKVSTYSYVAKAIECPNACRAVGNALNKNTNSEVPCHRVVRSDGAVGGFMHGTEKKIHILETEGISIANARVKNLENVIFRF
ncbi:MAG: MGMT family protein [Candidatus Aenigmarchaeota archaeon]|nr:MGMT family protein [Candidatus Aenigmarchaeota archaeon]MCK5333021.1 MGMT family protein [Candidatus Aenigmarchaeota archaeon]